MTEQEYQRARASIVGVTLGRMAAAILAVMQAIKGEYTGALVLFSLVPLLHFALPVIPDEKERRK